MTGSDELSKRVIKATLALAGTSVAKALWEQGKKRAVDKATDTAVTHATKPITGIVDQRRKNRLRNEDIYRLVDKLRVIGEAAVALGEDAGNDERQRIAKDSASLRDALHEQLAELRLSSRAQRSEVLDAIQRAVADADRLVIALNRWAMNSSVAGSSSALLEVTRALDASENALLSALDKSRRRRPKKDENGRGTDKN